MSNQYQLILAADLDGTFLEGNNAVEEYFYNTLLRLQESILLIYVTGRPIESVAHFCWTGYLQNYIIGIMARIS